MNNEESFRPKVGFLATAMVLGLLSFMTLFSVELTSLQLKNLTTAFSSSRSTSEVLVSPSSTRRSGENAKSKTRENYDDDSIFSSSNAGDDDISDDNYEKNYNGDDGDNLQLQISKGVISRSIPAHQINQAISQRNQELLHSNNNNNNQYSSPACHPHFHLYQPNGQWSNETKFKRILFYHARKAAGSSMNKYLVKVAHHYNIKLEWIEWGAMEEPGTSFHEDTFYVTHMREPIDRSISHFKYNGRWECRSLVKQDFVPTRYNAHRLETWNQTGGHEPTTCRVNRHQTIFKLGDCAVDCYTQWFGGLSCPQWEVPMEEQYQVAKSKLTKYNLVIIIEKLRDPRYVRAIENFFGVGGILEKGVPFCERLSHKANAAIPLVIHNETRARLTNLNKMDLRLYHDISDCLDDIDGQYDQIIPKWDADRFMVNSFNWTEAEIKQKKAKADKKKKLEEQLIA